jgi:hypothetical protein
MSQLLVGTYPSEMNWAHLNCIITCIGVWKKTTVIGLMNPSHQKQIPFIFEGV